MSKRINRFCIFYVSFLCWRCDYRKSSGDPVAPRLVKRHIFMSHPIRLCEWQEHLESTGSLHPAQPMFSSWNSTKYVHFLCGRGKEESMKNFAPAPLLSSFSLQLLFCFAPSLPSRDTASFTSAGEFLQRKDISVRVYLLFIFYIILFSWIEPNLYD